MRNRSQSSGKFTSDEEDAASQLRSCSQDTVTESASGDEGYLSGDMNYHQLEGCEKTGDSKQKIPQKIRHRIPVKWTKEEVSQSLRWLLMVAGGKVFSSEQLIDPMLFLG